MFFFAIADVTKFCLLEMWIDIKGPNITARAAINSEMIGM
ncbi:hypothetical protein LCGC14_0024210 [marine sediment metagenome]|uniref:Uncharacterized protein n=1 Tax=marine sediment metagenome TaxID=412755 RepID=A0A0F9WEQ9_9ZZZZ